MGLALVDAMGIENYCGECNLTIYDIPYSDGGDENGYLNPDRCPKCGGHLE